VRADPGALSPTGPDALSRPRGQASCPAVSARLQGRISAPAANGSQFPHGFRVASAPAATVGYQPDRYCSPVSHPGGPPLIPLNE
jgi:hypothetical protein